MPAGLAAAAALREMAPPSHNLEAGEGVLV